MFGPPVTIIYDTVGPLRHPGQATFQMVSSVYLLRQTHLGVWRTVSSENQKPRQQIFKEVMGKKHKDLFPRIVETSNLYSAYHKAAKGKLYTGGHLVFKQNLAANISQLRQALITGSYQPGPPNLFWVYEPKPREITAMPFMDRVAQHALCNVIEPIFDKVFLPASHACRTNKGTHSAAIAVQSALRQMGKSGTKIWVLKTDFSKYFYSVRRDVLHAEYRRKIACQPTLDLITKIIPAEGTGLPIGNLASQLSANLYGHIIDRWLAHKIGVTRFFRYMDDIVVLAHSREALDVLRMGMQWFAQATMGMNFSKWSLQPASRGVNFVGYRIWPTHKLLRRDSVTRAKRKIKRYTKRGETENLDKFLASWRGHAKWADSHNLMKTLGVAI